MQQQYTCNSNYYDVMYTIAMCIAAATNTGYHKSLSSCYHHLCIIQSTLTQLACYLKLQMVL